MFYISNFSNSSNSCPTFLRYVSSQRRISEFIIHLLSPKKRINNISSSFERNRMVDRTSSAGEDKTEPVSLVALTLLQLRDVARAELPTADLQFPLLGPKISRCNRPTIEIASAKARRGDRWSTKENKTDAGGRDGRGRERKVEETV